MTKTFEIYLFFLITFTNLSQGDQDRTTGEINFTIHHQRVKNSTQKLLIPKTNIKKDKISPLNFWFYNTSQLQKQNIRTQKVPRSYYEFVFHCETSSLQHFTIFMLQNPHLICEVPHSRKHTQLANEKCTNSVSELHNHEAISGHSFPH